MSKRPKWAVQPGDSVIRFVKGKRDGQQEWVEHGSLKVDALYDGYIIRQVSPPDATGRVIANAQPIQSAKDWRAAANVLAGALQSVCRGPSGEDPEEDFSQAVEYAERVLKAVGFRGAGF